MSDNQRYEYSYCAKQQEEIRRIRAKYLPKSEDKVERLRRLDASVTRKGTVIALVVGVLSTLILGIGMCCIMVWGGVWFVPGIFIGIIGIAGIAAAYPLYGYVTKKERERIAPEIIRLADEVLE